MSQGSPGPRGTTSGPKPAHSRAGQPSPGWGRSLCFRGAPPPTRPERGPQGSAVWAHCLTRHRPSRCHEHGLWLLGGFLFLSVRCCFCKAPRTAGSLWEPTVPPPLPLRRPGNRGPRGDVPRTHGQKAGAPGVAWTRGHTNGQSGDPNSGAEKAPLPPRPTPWAPTLGRGRRPHRTAGWLGRQGRLPSCSERPDARLRGDPGHEVQTPGGQ